MPSRYRADVLSRCVRGATLLFLLSASLAACRAQNFTTSVPSTSTQTWNDAIWQPGSVTATNGNTYEVLKGGGIWSPFPSTGELQNFPGDSLTLDAGSKLIVSGPLRYTLYFPGVNGQPGLILNGGRLRTEQETNDQVYRIVGSVSVTSNSVIQNFSGIGGISIVAQLSGTGGLTFMDDSLTSPLDIESTNNSYSGQWTVFSGYLIGVGDGSLGAGNITVAAGAVLEVDYDIQSLAALTLFGSNSVMVLHQDCQFSAITINGVSLPPGTYTYNNLLAQFPGNFADGGSGSLTVVPAPSVSSVAPPPPPPPSDLPGFYVDYSAGSDSNPGTNTAAPWKHCPGDPAATAVAASTPLSPGDTVFFKGGVQYVLRGNGNPIYQTGIGLNWAGVPGQPITYDGNSAGNWGTGRAIFTDNYSTNHIAAFYNYGAVNNLVFNNLEIGPIGGAPSLPPDPGTGVPSNQGYGIFAYGTMNNVTIQNCYFHDLGYWFNHQPMDADSLGGSDNRISGGGVIFYGATSVVITNCEFTKQHTAIEAAYSVNSSNITIASCFFHDYIVWSIDLAGISGNLDYTYIHDNTFQDVGWAYSPEYWTGYNYIPASCSTCYAGPPHQDGIFHRTGTTSVTNGGHIDIYNNTFSSTHLFENPTAYIYLEYAPSANIYNNLFNIPNAGIPNNAVPSDPEGGGAPPIVISYELNQPSTIQVLNNTFIINTTANVQNAAVHWSACGCLNPPLVWPSDGILQIENNLTYSFYNGADECTLLYPGVVTNQYPVSFWTVDYNDWHSQSPSDTWFWWNNQPGFNIEGGLAAARSVGFETHGITNNPQFVSLAFGSSTNASGNDYHLQSGSPAIGAGLNLSGLNLPGLNTDKDGNPRPASGPWDLGAYQQ